MNSRWRQAIWMLVAALTLSSCGSKSPATPSTPSPTNSVTNKPIQNAQIFYVGDTPSGFKLFSENYLTSDKSVTSLTKLISDLVDGSAQPLDPDYSNLWGHGNSLLSLKVSAPFVTVDLHLGKLNVGAEAELRAIDQIFWTIAKFMPNIKEMNLLIDGKKSESLAGHVDASKPFLLEPAYDVLSPLQITSITEGESLVSPVLVKGQACTFEANVAWKLFKDSIQLKSGAVVAKEACPTRSSWSLNLGLLSAGNYQLLVQDFSAKDGTLTAQDSKKFTVAKS